jgi:hypothetical protein
MITYHTGPGATVSTSGSINTEVDHIRFLTGSSKGAFFKKLDLSGQGAELTAIHAIRVRFYRYATPSTAGSAATPRSRTAPAATAVLTAFTAPTPGATPTLQAVGACGAAAPGGWQAWNRDSMIQLDAGGGAAGNLDLLSSSGKAALTFEYGMEHEE